MRKEKVFKVKFSFRNNTTVDEQLVSEATLERMISDFRINIFSIKEIECW